MFPLNFASIFRAAIRHLRIAVSRICYAGQGLPFLNGYIKPKLGYLKNKRACMNPHHATGLFLYSLKTLKNQMLTSTLQIIWPEQYLDVLWKTVVEFLFVKVSGLVEKELCRK